MLINALTILFNFTDLINPWELSLILIATAYAVQLLTSKNPYIKEWGALPTDTSLYMYLFTAWQGRLTLLRTFLPFYLILNGTLFYIDYRIENGSYTIASWVTMHIIFALPTLWWTTSVWRCSAYSPNRIWSKIARFLTITVFYEYLLRFIIRFYYPGSWFNCQQLAIEFGDCI